jgi:signal-transduction protein with cAMP-binding, CBS, and nucleotidyltransferase domain
MVQKVKTAASVNADKKLKVSDLVITDEFKTINVKFTGKDAAEKLMEIPRGVVLVLDDNKKAKGVLTAREFLVSIVKGQDPVQLKIGDLMNTDIFEIGYEEYLDDVVPKVTQHDPYAVVVVDKKGIFKGYFSPKDYQEALARINYQRQ